MKAFKYLTLTALTASALFVIGCSTTQPYSLTGNQPSNAQADEAHRQWRERMLYTDDKGHYHPEAAAVGRPIHPMPPL